MGVKLESSFLEVSINNHGAEINSVKNKSGLEFIWQADKNTWARHTPVLFPIVGKLKDNKYFFGGKEYSLPQHGFARDLKFDLLSQTKTTCSFQLKSTPETKIKFPFDFVFEINYRLNDSTLTTTYEIKNRSEGNMLFSVGAHPGFNCPLLPEEKFENYYLEFENSNYSLTTLNGGLRTNQKTNFPLSNNILPLSDKLFNNDALVFENNQINKITLRSSASNHQINMECNNWPYFGIWSKKDNQKFICLEPWHGIADNENTNQLFENKDGILHLKAHEEFRCSFSMSFL
jgi:galactose mutarotase-like enzyme